ncbi:MAG: hypothetical protein IK048_01840 [Clostridia bacterium]|nr:hypothetical protein [Clostridia bacterium]
MSKLSEDLAIVQEKIGYRFNNTDLLFQAFTRSSYSTQFGSENNEVLEFLGDKVLDFYVVKIIADEFGFLKSESNYYDKENDYNEFCIVAHKNEADFTDLKKEIVSNKTLAKRIDKLGFAKYFFLGDSDKDNHVERQEKVKADLFEAILGAVAIDTNWNPDILENVVANLLIIDDFFDDVDVEEERPDKFKLENAITTLKELGEHGICSIPDYDEPEDQVYFDNKYWWACTCTVRNWRLSKTAYGTSKKRAKLYAAYLVLCEHYNIPDEFRKEDDDDE